MGNSKDNIKKLKISELIGFNKKEKIGIGILLVLIISSPILFSQFSTVFSFQNTGQIGDTIGGITSPFVNLLAAFLVYKSFVAQIRANIQQREDHDEQMRQLQKEHSFDFISSYYSLLESIYDKNGYGQKPLYSLFELYEGLKGTRQFKQLGNQDNLENKSHEVQKELVKIKEDFEDMKGQFNETAESLIEQGVRDVQNIVFFLIELEKAEISNAVKYFYHSEIRKIAKGIGLSMIFSSEWSYLREDETNFLNKENLQNIEYISTFIKQMSDYKLAL